MTRAHLQVGLFIVAGSVAALYIGRMLAATSPLYVSVLTDTTMLRIGGLTKFGSLVLASVYAFRAARLLGHNNPASLPWNMLAAGLTAYALGQATLLYFQITTGVSPFPSIADIWFVISYPLLIAGVIGFIRAYTRSGFASGGMAATWIVLIAAAAIVVWPLLRPIVSSPDKAVPKLLNVIYFAFDVLLLIPAVALLRLTSRFRGGEVWQIWLALLTGFIFSAVGDLLFGYFSSVGLARLDPAVHAMYIVGYAALATGAMVQNRLLTA